MDRCDVGYYTLPSSTEDTIIAARAYIEPTAAGTVLCQRSTAAAPAAAVVSLMISYVL